MFFPKYYYKSAYDIPYRELFVKGKKAALFDLDNTLVEHGAPADERALKLMDELKSIGYRICFVSNNYEDRVKLFNEKIGADYIFLAGKPGPEAYLKACEMCGAKPEEAIFTGDQIFTDIWGANRAHVDSYLVKRIAKHEEIQIHIKRMAEIPILILFRLFCGKRCRL